MHISTANKKQITQLAFLQRLNKKWNHTSDSENLNQLTQNQINFVLQLPTNQNKPNKFLLLCYTLCAFLFGYTFLLKLWYKNHNKTLVALQSESHLTRQQSLVRTLKEERLNYVGSMVLGLNDALVELSGAIAGLTLAISNSRLISISAVITGIAASLSMASSQFLSEKANKNLNALKSSIYTGFTYLITVCILVLPYLLLPSHRFVSLGIMLALVLSIIFVFNWYIAIAKSQPFFKHFLQMAIISFSIATISFFIGFLVKTLFGVTV